MMPTHYSTCFNQSLLKQQKIFPSCRSLKAEDICGAISTEIFFVSWYRNRFCSCKLNYFSRWCLDIWSFTDKGVGIYPIWTKYMFFLTTLDGSASILRPKKPMNSLHSVLFTVKMSSEYPLFIATSLTVGKIDPEVIRSSRKKCETLPLLYPNILYHHILPLWTWLC